MEKKKTKQINLKLRTDLDQFVRDTAARDETTQIAIYERALIYLRTRMQIEGHIRQSVAKNMGRYDSSIAFESAMRERRPFGPWVAMRFVESFSDWILGCTYDLLADWERRGATPDALARVLETEYYVPKEAMTEPLPFADEPAAPAIQTPMPSMARATA